MVAEYDGLIEFTIGEIFEVSITTKEHIAKYGTRVAKNGETVELNKCDILMMITIDASTADGILSHWILSLEDFLNFMSIPNFRLLSEKNVNVYSTCVFWLLDKTYAQNILYNFSNYGIEDV
jgi:hypothetical protein